MGWKLRKQETERLSLIFEPYEFGKKLMGKKKYNLCVLRKGATKEKPDYFKPCPKPEQTPRDSEGQGGLACCSPGDCKDSDMIEQQQCDERFSP